MGLFLSLLGFFTAVTMWPIVLILHFLQVELLQDIPWSYVIGQALLGVCFNFCINFGIAYTYPLFISLGTVLGVPLNAVVDAVFRQVYLLNWKLTATVLILGSFLLTLLPSADSVYIQNKLCCKAVKSKQRLVDVQEREQ